MQHLIANENREFHLPVLFTNYHARIVIASLALGGAEKIVLDWAKAEANRGKTVEIAVLHRLENEWPIPKGVKVIRRGESLSVKGFVSHLASRWSVNKGAISTHLIRDNVLQYFWDLGIKTIPVFHNGKEGWKNDPTNFTQENVPMIIGCAEAVSNEIRNETNIPVVTIRHQASISKRAISLESRKAKRQELNIPDDALLIGAIGAMKGQKNYVRAIEVLAEVNKVKPAYFCILGGVLNQECQEQLKLINEKAEELGVYEFVKLPGFVNPVDDYLAAFDVVLNTSHHEGFSIATQEALVSGLKVIATKVNGQKEMTHSGLTLIEPEKSNKDFANALLAFEPRIELIPSPTQRVDRMWSIPNAWNPQFGKQIDTLFITANLNAGGAQRSLVNLAKEAKKEDSSFAIAVCNGCTNDYFSKELKNNGVNAFHFMKENDVFDLSRGLFTLILRHGIKKICFWNADPKIKLLLSKFANNELEIIDVSPGAYAFDEMKDTANFQASIGYSQEQFFERLDHLVFKHGTGNENIPYDIKNVSVIRNGVEPLTRSNQSKNNKFLVNGRIADSKHLLTIIDSFEEHLSTSPDSELVVYGQAESRNTEYLDKVLSRAADLPINFKGAKFDMSQLSDDYSAIIVLGTNQGCPNAVLEAISSGIPVIANDSGGTRELISNGSGLLIKEDIDKSDLIDALNQFNDLSIEDRIKMGDIGVKTAREHFSIGKMYQEYAPILFLDEVEVTAKVAA